MSQCVACGEALVSTAQFCPRCGTSVAVLAHEESAEAAIATPPSEQKPQSHTLRNVLIGVGVFILLATIALYVVLRSLMNAAEERRAEMVARVQREVEIAEGPRVPPRPPQPVVPVENFCGIEHYPGSVTKLCPGANCVKWESGDPAPDVIRWYARYYARDVAFGEQFAGVQAWSIQYERASISVARADEETQIVVTCRQKM